MIDIHKKTLKVSLPDQYLLLQDSCARHGAGLQGKPLGSGSTKKTFRVYNRQ